jgi:cyclopropane fatty-acyl-phospholipid synthase-like methyltransferase
MNAPYTEIRACRICGNTALDPVLHLGSQSLTGVFPKSEEEQKRLTRGPLELVKCRSHGPGGARQHCGLLQLRQAYAPAEMYGANYGYRSSLNRSMVEHLNAKVRRATARVPLQAGDTVLDIGSNDGTLLSAYPSRGIHRIGMDPTGEKFRRYYPAGIELVADFFSAPAFDRVSGGRRARIVTSIAMFYDLEKPLDFVAQVRDVLAEDGIWIFEQSYLPEMLRSGTYDTICHEHVEYYALAQIQWMMGRAGLKILDVELNAVNGGSFSVTAARQGAPHAADRQAVAALLAEEARAGLEGSRPYDAFRERVFRHREELSALIQGINARGKKVLGYGASTKGNVMLQFCGLTAADLPCIADVNEDKFGAFTPGTGIPIVSEAQAKAMQPDYLLVLPWHFRDNILQREQAYLRGGGRLIFPLPRIEIVGGAP